MRISFKQKRKKLANFRVRILYFCRLAVVVAIDVVDVVVAARSVSLKTFAAKLLRTNWPPSTFIAHTHTHPLPNRSKIVKLSHINGLSRTNERSVVAKERFENGTLCLRANANAFNIA